jgi:hypothetical protein
MHQKPRKKMEEAVGMKATNGTDFRKKSLE